MYLTDYHIHSKYSFDCETDLDEICKAAINRGIKEIAITDHMDIYSDKPYEHILDCKNLYNDLYKIKEKYADRLKVIVGAEYGQPQANEEQARKFIKDYALDFIIGSVHNMENDIDAYYLDYKELDYKEVMHNYIRWLKEMAIGYEFDVMGHITYPSRYIYQQIGVRVDYREYYEEYEELFKILIEKGRGIELNVSGIARGTNDTMPGVELLSLYRKKGGEIITVGSDAHVADHVGLVSQKGYEILKETGFKYISTFEERKLKNIIL